MAPVVQLLRHIYLGFAHVLAFLFLPTHKSFQTIHELTEAGYRVSYLDHCRIQHNMRFATLSYSLVLASIITLVTTTVEIIFPDRLATPVFAVTLTVNDNSDTNDGSCDAAPGDCTLREAIIQANSLAGTDTISVSLPGGSVVTLTDALPIISEAVVINGGEVLDIDCNGGFFVGLDIQSANTELNNLTVRNCADTGIAVKAGADNFVLSDSALYTNEYGIVIGASDSTISGSVIEDSVNHGIMILTASGITVSGNNIEHNSLDGLNGTMLGDSTITDNVFVGNLGSGMSCTQCSSTTISANFFGIYRDGINVNGNGVAGIELNGESDSMIIGDSVVTENAGNTFVNNPLDITIGDGAEQTVVRGNTTATTDVAAMIAYATKPIAEPIVTLVTPTSLAGTASADAIIDFYVQNDGTSRVIPFATAIAEGDGTWEISDDQLADYSTVYATATIAEIGTSPFTQIALPETAITISDITVSAVTTSSATITWQTNIVSNGKVDYGTAEDSLVSSGDDAAGVTNHEVTLTDLQANTTYYYQVRSKDNNNEFNIVTSDVQSFTTAADENPIPSEYAEIVASTPTVEYDGGTTDVVGKGNTTTILPFDDLTFVFTDTKDSLNDYRLHFILREAKKNAQAIVDKKKAFDAAGQAQFKIKKQQLSLEKTYAVLTGVMKDGTYVNDGGLEKRFNFTLVDISQFISPNSPVVYKNPEEWIVASKAPSVVVSIDNTDGTELMHCTAIMENGIGSCNMPFHVPGLGEYTIRLVDSRGGSISESILFSDIALNNTITFDSRRDDFYNRIIFSGQPTLAGLVGTGNTIEIHIPQIDGPMYAAVTGNSWVFTLTLTTLSYGATEFTVIERNPAGDIVNQNDYLVYRSYRPVIPAVIAPENNSSATTAPTIQVIGPDDHTLEIFNSENVRLFLGDFANGGRTVDLGSWFSDPGTYTITLRNRNSLNIPSTSTTFTFIITAPTTVSETTPTETTTETDNTNTSNNTDTNSSNTNTSTNTNTNQSNTNTTNSNSSNTNTTNTNTNSSTTDQTQPDTDSDGLSDIIEELVDTDPANPDTDEDDINDYDELTQDPGTDSDSDGFSDEIETDLGTDPTQPDTDGDGVSDAQEIEDRTDPTDKNSKKIVDTDKDGLADSEEPTYGTDPNNPDTDKDTMSDGDEVTFGSDPLTADGDVDGLTDPQEYALQTDPRQSDTDSDGVLDGAEVSNQTSPKDPDSDNDGLTDNEPAYYGTDALDADSDNDGLLDGEEIDRSCDPLNVDSDGDKIDDLVEALAGTDCSSTDNLWSNLSNIEAYLQEQANTVGVNYPLITHQIVSAEADLDQKLTQQITTATTFDIIPGAKTVVSDGTIRVITKTTELSIVDWLTGQNPVTTDNTYVLVSGTVSLPDSVQGQPAYVLVTFFSTPMVKIAQVDSNGQWTMTVPAELLTTGEHTALAALEVNGTRSEQVEVAKFVINHKRKLSSTSWLVIVNVVVAILALLIAVIVHLRRKRSDESYA